MDSALMSCRAVRPQDYDGARAEMWNKIVATGLTVPPDYPGRIFKDCQMCGIQVQVGPRQQGALEALEKDQTPVQILCLVCTAISVAMENDLDPSATYGLYNLGNPYKDKETP